MRIGASTRANGKYYHKIRTLYAGRQRYECGTQIWTDWEFAEAQGGTISAVSVLNSHNRLGKEERAFWLLKGTPDLVLRKAPCPKCFPDTKLRCPTCETPIPQERYKRATAKKSRKKKVTA